MGHYRQNSVHVNQYILAPSLGFHGITYECSVYMKIPTLKSSLLPWVPRVNYVWKYFDIAGCVLTEDHFQIHCPKHRDVHIQVILLLNNE